MEIGTSVGIETLVELEILVKCGTPVGTWGHFRYGALKLNWDSEFLKFYFGTWNCHPSFFEDKESKVGE